MRCSKCDTYGLSMGELMPDGLCAKCRKTKDNGVRRWTTRKNTNMSGRA